MLCKEQFYIIKIKIHIPFDSIASLLELYPVDILTLTYKNIHARMLITALFYTAKSGKQSE